MLACITIAEACWQHASFMEFLQIYSRLLLTVTWMLKMPATRYS